MSWLKRLIECLSACHLILRCKSKCCKGLCDSDCFMEEASGDNKQLKYSYSKSDISIDSKKAG
jgi:hypothetical protein